MAGVRKILEKDQILAQIHQNLRQDDFLAEMHMIYVKFVSNQLRSVTRLFCLDTTINNLCAHKVISIQEQ